MHDDRTRLHRTRCQRRLALAGARTSGYHLAFLIGTGLVIAAIVVTVTVLRPPEAEAEAGAQAEVVTPEPAYSEAA